MLHLEERLSLLKEELSKVTAEELYDELQSYEAVGPVALDYLSEDCVKHINKCFKQYSNKFGDIVTLQVIYVEDAKNNFVSACNDDHFDTCLAA